MEARGAVARRAVDSTDGIAGLVLGYDHSGLGADQHGCPVVTFV
jgi:hypothetical protein